MDRHDFDLPELAGLVTERHRPDLADLDLRSTGDLVTLMAEDQALGHRGRQRQRRAHRRGDRRHRRPAAPRRPADLHRRRDRRPDGRARRRRVPSHVQHRPRRRCDGRKRGGPRTIPRRSGGRRRGGSRRSRGARGLRRRRGRRHRRVRPHPVHHRGGAPWHQRRRPDGRHLVQSGRRAEPLRRPSDRARQRTGGHHRLDPAEGRHRPEGRAQHHLDRRDGPPRQDVRQPDGRHAGDQRQAARSSQANRRRRHGCFDGGRGVGAGSCGRRRQSGDRRCCSRVSTLEPHGRSRRLRASRTGGDACAARARGAGPQ